MLGSGCGPGGPGPRPGSRCGSGAGSRFGVGSRGHRGEGGGGLGVFSAVAQDPAGAIYQRSEELRRADMGRLADRLATKTPLGKGVTRRRAAELLFVLIGPALYRDFVLEAGWTPRE